MNGNPFEVSLIDTNKFMTTNQIECLARMEFVLENVGLGILTGEIGSGKSTMLRHIAKVAETKNYEHLYICVSKLKPKELYSEILYLLGETPPHTLINCKRMLKEIIETRATHSDKKILVIIDEAQDMALETLLEIRYLMNFEMDLKPIFPVILCGQPEFRKLLRNKKFESINQRIHMQYHLNGLTPKELIEYIDVRLEACKIKKLRFDESAINKIFSYTAGIPRIVNVICSGAIHDAMLKDEFIIAERHVQRTITDLDKQRGLVN